MPNLGASTEDCERSRPRGAHDELEPVRRAAVGQIAEGRLAVRTSSGKPLVYADVFDSGKARVYTAQSCF
jgi:hypothetical protein